MGARHAAPLPEKKTLRDAVRAAREALSASQRRQKSAAITRRLSRLAAYREARMVFAYFSVRSEVQTFDIIRQALRAGKRVALPVSISRGRRLIFREVTDFKADLKPGLLGIPEPKPSRPRVAPREADLIIVPGVAFDRRGYRLGTGGGFYDRFLRRVTRPARVGLAFEAQLVDKVPHAEHDERVDYIVTERRVIRCRPPRGVT